VITAGANGIGEGSAMALAGMGADIVIGDIDEANGLRVRDAVRAMGLRAEFVAGNMMDEADARALVREAVARMGALDVLVNNAGGVRPRPFAEQTEGNWQRVIDLNLMSMLRATHEAA